MKKVTDAPRNKYIRVFNAPADLIVLVNAREESAEIKLVDITEQVRANIKLTIPARNKFFLGVFMRLLYHQIWGCHNLSIYSLSNLLTQVI